AAAQEWLINQFAALRMVQDRAPHQFNRLLRRVIELVFVGAAHDELRGRRSPDCRIFAGLPVPGRVLFPDEPAGLMLKPIKSAREDRSSFVPNDLLVVNEADAKKPVQDLASELRSMPDVRHLE